MKFGVNPWKMGLLGGLAGFANGYGQYLNQQRLEAARLQAYQTKYSEMASVAQLREQNNMLLKSLSLEANQRTYQVPKQGADGKMYMATMRNTYDPATHSFTPTQMGDLAPMKDPLAATNLNNATRLKVAGMQIDAANARNASNQSRNAQLQTELDNRQSLRESGLNRRSANAMTNQQMKEFDKASPDDQAQMLSPYNIDPTDKQARSKYRQALLQENLGALGQDQAPASSGQSGAQPMIGPDGKPMQDGTTLRGPDGKLYQVQGGQMVPLSDASDPNADASIAQTGTADGSPLAMDDTFNSPDYQNAGQDDTDDDTSDQDNTNAMAQAGGLMGSDDEDDTQDGQDEPQGLMNVGQYS